MRAWGRGGFSICYFNISEEVCEVWLQCVPKIWNCMCKTCAAASAICSVLFVGSCDPYAISIPHLHVQSTFSSYLVNLAGRTLADEEGSLVHYVILQILSFSSIHFTVIYVNFKALTVN